MEYNFKTIKDKSSNNLLENLKTKNNEFSYNNFIKEIKNSHILKTEYIVYSNIENEHFDDKYTAELFLNENLNLFKSYTKKEIISENKKIALKYFKGNYSEDEDKLFNLILESTKDIKIKDLSKKSKLFAEIVNKLIEPKVIKEEKNIDLINNKTLKRAAEILKEEYSFLNEMEMRIFETFLNGDENNKEDLYYELIKENVNLIKRKLFHINEEEDPEIIEKLNLTKEKLQESKYNSEFTINEYIKLLELNESLKL